MPLQPKDIDDPEHLSLMVPEEVSDVVAWLANNGSATLSGSQTAVDPQTTDGAMSSRRCYPALAP